MAIGKTGSFATTQAAGFDVASMMKGAQKEQSRLAKQGAEIDAKIQQDKNQILQSLKTPDAESTGEYNVDTFIHKGVDLMKDKQYEAYKKMQAGDISRAEMQGLAATFNRELDSFTNDVAFLSEGAKNMISMAENGELTEGMSDETVIFFEDFLKGKIDDVKVGEKGGVTAMVNGQEVDLKQFRARLENLPKNSDLDGKIKAMSDDFVSRIEEYRDPESFFTEITKEGMTPSQESEIEDAAKALANDPSLHNDLWFKAFGEKDIYALNEKQVGELEAKLADDMKQKVSNRMKSSLKKKYNYSDALASRKFNAEQEEKEEQNKIEVTGETEVNLSQGFNLTEENEAEMKEMGFMKRGDSKIKMTTINDGSVVVPFAEMTGISGGKSGEEINASDLTINAFKYNEETGDIFVSGYYEEQQGSISKSETTSFEGEKKIPTQDGDEVVDTKISERKTSTLPKEKKRVKATGILTGSAANELKNRLIQEGIITEKTGQAKNIKVSERAKGL